jgi:hypothetical protein
MNKVSYLVKDVLAESHREVSCISANVVFFLVLSIHLESLSGYINSGIILNRGQGSGGAKGGK